MQENVRTIVHFVGMVRTREDALAAADASIGKVTELGPGMLPFGVVAPETTHRASLEKHSGADAWSVVQGKTLDVENNSSCLHCDTVKGG